MKTRRDFVSNSSSCSFVIENPYELKFDSNLVNLLASANYIHFIDVDYGKMRRVGKNAKLIPGKTVKEYDRFKEEVNKAFGSKGNVGYEHRDCDEVPPEEVYVELETYNFWKNYSAKKRNLLERLVANTSMIHVNFGDDCDGGIEHATQIATLLDYIYGADIIAEDMFSYSTVKDLGIVKEDNK